MYLVSYFFDESPAFYPGTRLVKKHPENPITMWQFGEDSIPFLASLVKSQEKELSKSYVPTYNLSGTSHIKIFWLWFILKSNKKMQLCASDHDCYKEI